MTKNLFLALLILPSTLAAYAQTTTNKDPETAKIVTSDIALFWKVYDSAKPESNLNYFRDEYLRKGSIGLQEFTRIRIGSSCNLVTTIETAPKYYAALRTRSQKVESYTKDIRAGFRKLKELYPEAVFPDVYFVIGRMNSAGTLTDKGLLIGIDMFGRSEDVPMDELSDWHRDVVSPMQNLPFVVAHELIHYQQNGAQDSTLLARAIGEGSADFVAELASGGTFNGHLHEFGNPREQLLWEEFKKEMLGKDTSKWLYGDSKTKDRPADLGYYIGYKIAESYYKHAEDKKTAVSDILNISDYQQFLEDSRYDQKFRAAK